MASQNDSTDQKPPGPFDQPDSHRTLAIDVEGRRFWLSRELLAGYSPVFKEMLYGGFAEAKKDVIVLPEKKANDFEKFLLCLIPTPKVKEIDLSNVDLMLAYADEYQIDDMRQRSVRALIDMVKQGRDNDQRMLKILRIASDYSLIDELKVIVKKCALGFEIEQLKPMFKELPLEVVTALMLYKSEIPSGRKCKFEYQDTMSSISLGCCKPHKMYFHPKCVYCNIGGCWKCLEEKNPALVKGICGMPGISKVEQDVHDLLDRLAKD